MDLASPTRSDYSKIKVEIHHKLIQRLDLERINQLDRETVKTEVGEMVATLAAQENAPMTLLERERLAQEVLDEVFGLGPLEPLGAEVEPELLLHRRLIGAEAPGMFQ